MFDPGLIGQFFQLGIMGIEIPKEYGGVGGKFFESILAVEELSRVDASAGVVVDVQNTLVNNAMLRWEMKNRKSVFAAPGLQPVWRLRAQRSEFRFRRIRVADQG